MSLVKFIELSVRNKKYIKFQVWIVSWGTWEENKILNKYDFGSIKTEIHVNVARRRKYLSFDLISCVQVNES